MNIFILYRSSDPSKKRRHSGSDRYARRRNARIRWFLAYTLINNEELRLNRAHAKRLRIKHDKIEERLREKEEKALKKQKKINKIISAIRPRASSKIPITPEVAPKKSQVSPTEEISVEKYTTINTIELLPVLRLDSESDDIITSSELWSTQFFYLNKCPVNKYSFTQNHISLKKNIEISQMNLFAIFI